MTPSKISVRKNKSSFLYKENEPRSETRLTSDLWNTIKKNSLKRNHEIGFSSLDEFRQFYFTNIGDLYTKWEKSGFCAEHKPSVDRINDNIGYTQENSILTTFGINDSKNRFLFRERIYQGFPDWAKRESIAFPSSYKVFGDIHLPIILKEVFGILSLSKKSPKITITESSEKIRSPSSGLDQVHVIFTDKNIARLKFELDIHADIALIYDFSISSDYLPIVKIALEQYVKIPKVKSKNLFNISKAIAGIIRSSPFEEDTTNGNPILRLDEDGNIYVGISISNGIGNCLIEKRINKTSELRNCLIEYNTQAAKKNRKPNIAQSEKFRHIKKFLHMDLKIAI